MKINKPTILNHTKPLNLRAYVNRKSFNKVLVDNRSAVNLIPLRLLLSLGTPEDDIISSYLLVIAITRDIARTMGIIKLKISMGNKTSIAAFFVNDSNDSYKLLGLSLC